MSTNFLAQTFWTHPGVRDIPTKLPGYPRLPPSKPKENKLSREGARTFRPPPLRVKTSTPPGGLRTQKVNLCALFSCLTYERPLEVVALQCMCCGWLNRRDASILPSNYVKLILKSSRAAARRESKRQMNRGNRTESLWEANLPLRSRKRGPQKRGPQSMSVSTMRGRYWNSVSAFLLDSLQ